MAKIRLYSPGHYRLRDTDVYIICTACMIIVMLCISCFTGLWPWTGNPYNSYTLQAKSWLEGRLDLGKDYPWLELAIYQEKYYVSFPPFPSYVLLPFAFFTDQTPDFLIVWSFTLIGVICAVRLCFLFDVSPVCAVFWSLFLYLGSGYLFIGQTGYVWFMAQVMAFSLSMLSLLCAVENRGGFSLAFWACAVGCRPFTILYLPLLFYLLRQNEKDKSVPRWIYSHLIWALAPTLIAASYMILNTLRFGNPVEFGHNYLPEFVRAERGQFSLSYVPEHLLMLFRLPNADPVSGKLVFQYIDTNAFFLICPFSVSFLLAFVSAVRSHRNPILCIMLPILSIVHILLTCMHRTLGGYQFGNRYFVDLMPFLFLGILCLGPKSERFTIFQLPLFMMGAVINVIGTVTAYCSW